MKKKMEVNWIYVTLAIVAGVLAGLYIVGKRTQKKTKEQITESKIKVSGNDIEDLKNKLKVRQGTKNVVDFECLTKFSYESLVEWINNIDIKDIDKEVANYGCLIVRSSSDLDLFNLDMSKLTTEQQNHILGAIIINTENKKILGQRWIVCDILDNDLLEVFGQDNIKMLK